LISWVSCFVEELQCIAQVSRAAQLIKLGFLVNLFNGHNWRERGEFIWL